MWAVAVALVRVDAMSSGAIQTESMSKIVDDLLTDARLLDATSTAASIRARFATLSELLRAARDAVLPERGHDVPGTVRLESACHGTAAILDAVSRQRAALFTLLEPWDIGEPSSTMVPPVPTACPKLAVPNFDRSQGLASALVASVVPAAPVGPRVSTIHGDSSLFAAPQLLFAQGFRPLRLDDVSSSLVGPPPIGSHAAMTLLGLPGPLTAGHCPRSGLIVPRGPPVSWLWDAVAYDITSTLRDRVLLPFTASGVHSATPFCCVYEWNCSTGGAMSWAAGQWLLPSLETGFSTTGAPDAAAAVSSYASLVVCVATSSIQQRCAQRNFALAVRNLAVVEGRAGRDVILPVVDVLPSHVDEEEEAMATTDAAVGLLCRRMYPQRTAAMVGVMIVVADREGTWREGIRDVLRKRCEGVGHFTHLLLVELFQSPPPDGRDARATLVIGSKFPPQWPSLTPTGREGFVTRSGFAYWVTDYLVQ